MPVSMRPLPYAVRSGPRLFVNDLFLRPEKYYEDLTWALIRHCIVIVSRLINMAIPIHRSAMRPDGESLVQRMLRRGAEWGIFKIQTSVGLKLNVHHLFQFLVDCFYASNLLDSSHSRPPLEQLNPSGTLHDDVFATNGI